LLPAGCLLCKEKEPEKYQAPGACNIMMSTATKVTGGHEIIQAIR